MNVSNTCLKFTVNAQKGDQRLPVELKTRVLTQSVQIEPSRPPLNPYLQFFALSWKGPEGHTESLDWSDFIAHLEGKRNPFIVAELKPGMQQFTSEAVRDGGANPLINAEFTMMYTPLLSKPKDLVHTDVCRLVVGMSFCVFLGNRRMKESKHV